MKWWDENVSLRAMWIVKENMSDARLHIYGERIKEKLWAVLRFFLLFLLFPAPTKTRSFEAEDLLKSCLLFWVYLFIFFLFFPLHTLHCSADSFKLLFTLKWSFYISLLISNRRSGARTGEGWRSWWNWIDCSVWLTRQATTVKPKKSNFCFSFHFLDSPRHIARLIYLSSIAITRSKSFENERASRVRERWKQRSANAEFWSSFSISFAIKRWLRIVTEYRERVDDEIENTRVIAKLQCHSCRLVRNFLLQHRAIVIRMRESSLIPIDARDSQSSSNMHRIASIRIDIKFYTQFKAGCFFSFDSPRLFAFFVNNNYC